MDPDVVTRFAPSPTGALHPGNARTALFSFLLARAAAGASCCASRTRTASAAASHTSRPSSRISHGSASTGTRARVAKTTAVPTASRSAASLYAGLFERLEREGHAYPCYCTPAELEVARRTQLAAGEPPRYPGTCRGLDAAARAARAAGGRSAALRFAMPDPGNPAFRRPGARPAGSRVGDARRFPGAARRRRRRVLLLQRRRRRADGRDARAARRRSPEQHAAPAAAAARARAAGAALWPPAAAARRGRRAAVQAARQRHGRGAARSRLPAAALGNYLLRLGHHGAPDDWVEPRDMPRNFHVDKLGRAPAHFDPVQLDHWQREAVRRLDRRAAARWLAAEFPADWPRRAARVDRGPAAGQRAAAGRRARLARGARRHAAAAAGRGGGRDRGGGAGVLRRGARVLR